MRIFKDTTTIIHYPQKAERYLYLPINDDEPINIDK